MRHIRIRTRILSVLLVGVLAAIAIQTVDFARASAELNELQSRTSDLIRLQSIAGTLEEAIHTEATAIREFLLKGGSTDDLAPYESARTIEANLAGEFAALDATFPTIHDEFRTVIDAAAAWRAGYVEPTMRIVAAGGLDEVTTMRIVAAGGLDEVRQRVPLDKGATLFRAVHAAMAELQHDVDILTAATLARLADISRASFASLVIGVGILLVGALIAAWLLTRWVARPLARLASTAQRVEGGESVEFPSGGDDEIGTLGGALERMRRALSRQAREASVINRFTELTSFIESDGDVARATMQALEELTRPSDGAIHISNRSKDRAVPEASLGEITPEVVSLGTLATCPGVRRSGLYVTADSADRLAVRCPIHSATSGTLACIPLIALGEVVGAAHLHWDATDGLPLDLHGAVSRIADHASLSVANRRLVAALQGQASSDPRTGLANSRTFDAALEEALRTRTAVEPLTVLLLDVDHFKAFNDRHGHPAGDEALRALAGVLRATVRGHDIAARYGGEEFAVMLPDLDSTGGASVAERIRARIESTIIQLAPGLTDRVTISIGVAAYPAHAADRMELLKTADAALYAAKKAGRNRVVVATAVGADTLEESAAPVIAVADAGGRRRR